MESLIPLLNAQKKRDAEKAAREILVTKGTLANLAWAGRLGRIPPIEYACHFDEIVPEHLPPTPDDLSALASSGVGLASADAAKAIRKVGQIFRDRCLFSAHLFYEPPGHYWHLFFFDQRDYATVDNHWKHGPHIHYSSDLIAQRPLDEVWSGICKRPPTPPKSLHLRFLDRQRTGGRRLTRPCSGSGN